MSSDPTEEALRIDAIGRDGSNERALVLYLSRPATDDEMRAIQEALRQNRERAHVTRH